MQNTPKDGQDHARQVIRFFVEYLPLRGSNGGVDSQFSMITSVLGPVQARRGPILDVL